MLEYLRILLGSGTLAPHGYCLLWQPELIWTHVVADALIAAAYFSIPIAIVRFVRGRKDVEFSWIFWLFALFILACGTTHLMAIWTLWRADYGWEALIKVITAIASVGTAIVLWPLIPKALALPSPLQLREANTELSIRVQERDQAVAQLQTEIVERQRAEAALLQAQKMEAVGQLTGGIAHDFNNLLQAVSGMFELIVKKPEDSERVRAWAERGLQAADRGTRLTAQLLAFSRVQQLSLKPVPVAPLIGELLDLLDRTLGSHVQVRTECDEADVVVLADKTQLELAILNLSINARDAMPDGGTVTIAVRRNETCSPELYPKGCVDIVVSDTGTGMPPEVVERAFEPFFTTKGIGKGTGLGLSMVYGVARQSGGEVRIDTAEGKGTSVTISLRRAHMSGMEDSQPAASPTAEPQLGEGQMILVVDDDDDVRATIRQALEVLAYEVEEAEDGASALVKLRASRPEAAIFDFAMPNMNGAELAREAVKIHPGLPIIFASGYAETKAVEDAVGKDAKLLNKPFQIGELAQLLSDAIERSRGGNGSDVQEGAI